ncbi:MAG: thiol protease/hemagglutinin PrtT [Bacteroidales bacterium]|nr:thiol protease/hemagglutinin PrtT [Bacteroidales bacterium]
MKTKFSLILGLILILNITIFAKEIPINEARIVAKNFLYEKTGINQSKFSFTESTVAEKGENILYVFNIKNGGFVLVAADDNYYPIIGYSFDQNFKTEGQPENVKWWINQYIQDIKYVKENNIKASNSNLWSYYNISYSEFSQKNSPKTKTVIVEPLTENILWNQDAGWNEACPADAAGPDGHVYAGCVATAMSIIMKYWNYPINGSGSHSYNSAYGTLTANYGNTTYMWSYMDNTNPNWYSALLMYHAGVAVNMGYSPTGSGAYSWDVPTALENYFNYNYSAEYVSKSSYSEYTWINTILKPQLDAAKPVYYSGRDDSNGGHAFVCDGYDDSDYFHYNFGWGGSANGLYSLSSVGGFHNSQAAVINIIPNGNYDYPAAPQTIIGEIDTINLESFKVNLEWTAPSTKEKSLTGYDLYRGDAVIQNNLSTSTFSFIDENAAAVDNYYGIRAKYSDGSMSLCAMAFVDATFSVTIHVSNTDGDLIHPGTAELNGTTTSIGFGSANFYQIPFGYNYNYSLSATGYTTYYGTIDILYKQTDIYVVLNYADINSTEKAIVIAYPNPSNGVVYLSGLEKENNVTVFDTNGKLVFEQQNVVDKSEINLTNTQSGVYIMNISTGGNTIQHKLIIK